jgi:DNA-binding transcriptional ArsR family regulator
MTADALSATFAALADPTRRAILARLSEGEATVGELAAPHAMSLPAVSRHLKVLEAAGLIAKSRDAQWRYCRLEAGPLEDADAWLEGYRRFFTVRLARLEAQLDAEQRAERADHDERQADHDEHHPAPRPAARPTRKGR